MAVLKKQIEKIAEFQRPQVMTSILQSKLIIPLFSDVVKRTRLNPVFSEIERKPITVVIAGAGYGKTTFIAQSVQSSQKKTVWLRLDRSDADLHTLFQYLIKGLQQYFDDFGVGILAELSKVKNLKQEWERLAIDIVNELASLTNEEIRFVLDDYHLINDDLLLAEALQFLLNHLPRNLQVTFISREELGLPLSRYRAMRMLAEVGEKELSFTLDETEQVMQQLFGLSLSSSELENLHSRTRGWIAGLVLVYHGMKNKTPRLVDNERPHHHKSVRDFVSEYLEENIYRSLSEALKDFLKKTSILAYLSSDLCNALLEIDNAGDILNELATRRLFTSRPDAGQAYYIYHHLFKEFLQEQCRQELSKQEYEVLQSRAAELWEKEGENEEALKHFLAANQHRKALAVLDQISKHLLKSGRLHQLDSYFNAFPEEMMEEYPWLYYSRARLHEVLGRQQEAIVYSEKAYKLFSETGNKKGMGLCLSLSGYNHFQSGDFEAADRVFKKLLASQLDDPKLSVQIYSNLIFISSHFGQMEQADAYYRKARQLLPQLKRPDIAAFLNLNLGFRYGKAGDFGKALTIGLEVRNSFLQLEEHHYVPFGYHLIAWSCFYLGRHEEGLHYAKVGLETANAKGYKDNAYGWLLMDAAMTANELGDGDYAQQCGLESLEHFKKLGSYWGQVYACQVLLMLFSNAGDTARAETYGDLGLELTRQFKLPLETGLLKTTLARYYISNNRLEDVPELLDDAEYKVRRSIAFSILAQLCRARYFQVTGESEKTFDRIRRALGLANKTDLHYCFDAEKNWIVDALVDCYANGIYQERILELLQRWQTFSLLELSKPAHSKASARSSASRQILIQLKRGPKPPLKMGFLGAFWLKRGNCAIENKAWHSHHAKTLLQYLVTHRARGFIRKEVLIELLWPESSPRKSSHRLQVALSSLRKILEPENQEKMASSYLLREGDGYRIDIGEKGWVDIEAFESVVKKAASLKPADAIPHYLEAELLYKGDFLEECPYDDWCNEIRLSLQERYLSVLNHLIRFYDAEYQYDACIVYAGKYLRIDPFAETIYRKLMQYYAWSDYPELIQATFKTCQLKLREGLDIEPSEETLMLYRELAGI